MTAPGPASTGIHDRPLLGIACVVMSYACFSVSDALAKAVLASVSTPQLLAARSVAVLLLFMPVIIRAGGLASLRTRRKGEHLLRVGCALVSIFCFFEAFRRLEFATAIALGFVAPLFMTALSVPLLGERVGVHRWSAVAIGFVGALVIIDPRSAGIAWPALLVLLAALSWALQSVIVRRLAATETDASMLVFQNGAVLLVAAAIAPFAWQAMGVRELLLILGIAAALVVGQAMMLRAYRVAPVGALAPFQYLELIGATVLGWLFWNEFPGANVWWGAAIVIGSGLYVVWRERLRARAVQAAS
jgi:drug/metabolite transporter (DMT)-like permease